MNLNETQIHLAKQENESKDKIVKEKATKELDTVWKVLIQSWWNRIS